MNTRIMHDLKPDRPDLTPPLPSVAMAIPFLFYFAVSGSLALGAWFTLQTRKAQTLEQEEIAAEQDERRVIDGIKAEQKTIDDAYAKAREVETWVDSSQPLMSIVASVVNSVKTGNTLSSLRLTRAAENPDHLELRLQINNGGTQQKEETVQALVREGLQTFRDDVSSTDRNNRFGDVTYTATLVKNRPVED